MTSTDAPPGLWAVLLPPSTARPLACLAHLHVVVRAQLGLAEPAQRPRYTTGEHRISGGGGSGSSSSRSRRSRSCSSSSSSAYCNAAHDDVVVVAAAAGPRLYRSTTAPPRIDP